LEFVKITSVLFDTANAAMRRRIAEIESRCLTYTRAFLTGSEMAQFEGWEEALAEAVAQGGGSIAIRLIDIARAPALLDAARHEGPESRALRDLSAVGELLEAARLMSRKEAPRCLICRKSLHGKRHIASAMLLRAARDDAGRSIFAMGCCEDCVRSAGGHQHLWPVILKALREVSPGLRDLSPQLVDEAGHA
jgi:hypothetical protein